VEHWIISNCVKNIHAKGTNQVGGVPSIVNRNYRI
jgi:hypothetical protein